MKNPALDDILQKMLIYSVNGVILSLGFKNLLNGVYLLYYVFGGKTLTKLVNWFKNIKIRSKIIVIYIPLVFIPILILGLVSNSISTNAVISKTIKNVSDNSNLIITRIDGMILNAESCANMLSIQINRILGQERYGMQANTNELQLYNLISNQLSFSLLIFTDVESAAYISADGKIFSTDPELENGLAQALNSNILKDIDKTNGNNIWFPMQKRDFLIKNQKMPVLTLGKKVISTLTGKKLGVLVLNMKESTFSAIYKSMIPTQNGSYFLANKKGEVVSSQNSDELLIPIADSLFRQWVVLGKNRAEIKKIEGKSMLITCSPFTKQNWMLISKIPLKELTVENREITLIISLIGFICLLFAIIGAGLLSKLIVNPIVRLKKEMLRIKDGNFDSNFEMNSTDEIGLLSWGFNTMLKRIRELIENINYEQRKKREYELALIQSQIKPHFLYNTLDVIYTLSEMGRTKDVQKTTKALADFYRIALSKGREIITISEEISGVKDYLAIQKIRYSDVFDYEISMQEETLESDILKLTTQPLVENAIYHGLKTKGSMGKIVIQGYIENETIYIKVVDDGVGIPPENLKKLLASKNRENNGNYFGLSNVDERIKLYFGQQYGLSIQSQLGKGTEVTVTLPLKIGGENQDA